MTNSQNELWTGDDAFNEWNEGNVTDSVAYHSYRVNQRKPFVAGFNACNAMWEKKLDVKRLAKIVANVPGDENDFKSSIDITRAIIEYLKGSE